MLALLPCVYCYCGVVKFYFLLEQSQKEFRCINSVEKKLVCVHGTSLLPLRCSHSAARGGGGLSLTATRSALFVNLRVVSTVVGATLKWFGIDRGGESGVDSCVIWFVRTFRSLCWLWKNIGELLLLLLLHISRKKKKQQLCGATAALRNGDMCY